MNKRTEEMGDIESLIKSKNIDNSRWYPISIDFYRNDVSQGILKDLGLQYRSCLLYTSPSPRDLSTSRMPSSA